MTTQVSESHVGSGDHVHMIDRPRFDRVLMHAYTIAALAWSAAQLVSMPFDGRLVVLAVGSVILLSGVSQPLVLLVIASSLNGLVMFVYSVLLIQLNRGMLPRAIGLKACATRPSGGPWCSTAASRSIC